MDNQVFKLSKTGIIIIAIIAVIVILFGILVYIARKKQQEIDKEKEPEPEAEPEPEHVGFSEVVSATGSFNLSDTELFTVFEDYRTGKYNNVKEAIAASGLTNGTFYRRLKKYENRS